MDAYLESLDVISKYGEVKENRTGVNTRSIFGAYMAYDLTEGFPLVTTKEVSFKNIVAELLWFISGSTNINDLDSKIWDEWADKEGELGPIYGKQWRDSNGVDQITELEYNLVNNPFSRRHIISAWNPGVLPDEGLTPQQNVAVGRQALAPCHVMAHFNVSVNKDLSCIMYQRSADFFLGVPYNIASYSLLTMMLAKVCGYNPGTFIHFIGDAHIYENHLPQVETQLRREPRELPRVDFPRRNSITDYVASDFELVGYDPWDKLIGKVAV